MRAADFALGVRVEGGFAIDEEHVLVMAVMQFEPQEPAAVGHALQGVSGGVPAVEVADERDAFGAGRAAKEIDQVQKAFCGISGGRAVGEVGMFCHGSKKLYSGRRARKFATKN